MPTIEITTAQKVTIEYELATFRDRVIAFLMDQLILLVLISVFTFLVNEIFGFSSIFLFLMVTPIYVFYSPFSEILLDGQTLGKRVVGIKTVKLTGREPSNIDYLTRWAFRLIDIYLSAGIISAMLVNSSSKAQRLGDITSNTVIIKIKFYSRFRLEDIENISSIESYQPYFYEVKKLNEEDVLLIKQTLSRSLRYDNQAHRELIQELVNNLVNQLELDIMPRNNIEFLKTLIRDYIVLTR